MKPRLPVAPLTDDDIMIWLRVIHGIEHLPPPALLFFGRCVAADRRDANLMLVLGWWRVQQFVRRWYYAAMAGFYPGIATDDKWWPPITWDDALTYPTSHKRQ